jgi:hypothetical protein
VLRDHCVYLRELAGSEQVLEVEVVVPFEEYLIEISHENAVGNLLPFWPNNSCIIVSVVPSPSNAVGTLEPSG